MKLKKPKKGTGILESLDKVTKEGWEQARQEIEDAERQSDEWLKGLIDEYDRKNNERRYI